MNLLRNCVLLILIKRSNKEIMTIIDLDIQQKEKKKKNDYRGYVGFSDKLKNTKLRVETVAESK